MRQCARPPPVLRVLHQPRPPGRQVVRGKAHSWRRQRRFTHTAITTLGDMMRKTGMTSRARRAMR
jgi:hypothetical protein